MMEAYVVRRNRSDEIGVGGAVLRKVQELTEAHPEKQLRVVAVVPRMLHYFSTAPKRYEVAEADLLVEWVR